MRLAKYLAHAGVASRRRSEDLIAEGRVTLDGELVTDPACEVAEGGRVTVDGRALSGPEPRVAYMLHKPPGVLSTARDERGRTTVVDLLGDTGRRLYPVGRLDRDTSGLIILTNDGGLANRLTHPRFEVPRTYNALLGGGPLGAAALRSLRGGVVLDDGPTAPAQVRRLGKRRIELTIHEGRNRQVRRMCEAVGHPVLELRRVGFGGLRLGRLPPGGYRRLQDAEVRRLRELAERV